MPDIRLPVAVSQLMSHLRNRSGVPCWLVGGVTRAAALQRPHHGDYDIQVFGLPWQQTVDIARMHGQVQEIKNHAPIIRVTLRDEEGQYQADISIPKRNGAPRISTDPIADLDPGATLTVAACQRDFTMNAIYYNPFVDTWFDPLHGIDDLTVHRRLVGIPGALIDDPSRVMRAMRFVSEFDLRLDETTANEARNILDSFDRIPKEVMWANWLAWASKSVRPSNGLHLLVQTAWINHFPQIQEMLPIPQSPEHHPEGLLWRHIWEAVDIGAWLVTREDLSDEEAAVLMLSIVSHDMGKVPTTVVDSIDGIISPGHAQAGVPLAKQFLNSIGAPQWLINEVEPLVREHMSHLNVTPNTRNVFRLSTRLHPSSIEMWRLLVEADASSRPPLPRTDPGYRWLLLAQENEVAYSKPEPIIKGRHLIDLGLEPGYVFKSILEQAFRAQLDQVFTDLFTGLQWLEAFVEKLRRLAGDIDDSIDVLAGVDIFEEDKEE